MNPLRSTHYSRPHKEDRQIGDSESGLRRSTRWPVSRCLGESVVTALRFQTGGSLEPAPGGVVLCVRASVSLYRMLSRPYAFGCVLRLRTSSEFKTGHSYGHFFPDPQYENVQHIICCDSYATHAYDFEFEATKEFSKHGSEPPIIQIAFQYTVFLPPEELTDSGLVSSVSF